VTVHYVEETDYQGNKTMEDGVNKSEGNLKTSFDLGNLGIDIIILLKRTLKE
jgi:hypothetical protein